MMLPSHTLLTAGDTAPEQLLLVLHGILGQGLNWRGVARRLIAAKPRWGAVLVDLRAHGDSRDLAPPDTLATAASDLSGLFVSLPAPVRGVLGHSFGGKVALELVAQRPETLTHLFVVDSLPGARPDRRGSEGTERVVAMLEALPPRFADRDAFVAHVKDAGSGNALASWLAQSLDRTDDGFTFGLDMTRIRALLDDYFERDLFPVIDPPPDLLDVHLIVGGKSSVWSPEDRERGRALAASYPSRVHFHVLEEADHWVHVDDPEGLHAIVAEAL